MVYGEFFLVFEGRGGGVLDVGADGGQAEKNKAIEQHWFRSERQSLRRYVVPKSGFGMVFSKLLMIDVVAA